MRLGRPVIHEGGSRGAWPTSGPDWDSHKKQTHSCLCSWNAIPGCNPTLQRVAAIELSLYKPSRCGLRVGLPSPPTTAAGIHERRHGRQHRIGSVVHRVPTPQAKGEDSGRPTTPALLVLHIRLVLTLRQCDRKFPCSHCLKRGVSHLCVPKASALKSGKDERLNNGQ